MNKESPDSWQLVADAYILAPSRQLAAILAAGHCTVAALVLMLDISPVSRFCIVLLLAASLTYEIWTAALRRGAHSLTALRFSRDRLSAQTRGDGWREYEVLGSSYVTSVLTILNLRAAGERRIRSIVLLPDSLAENDFRRLRVWLRWRPDLNRD